MLRLPEGNDGANRKAQRITMHEAGILVEFKGVRCYYRAIVIKGNKVVWRNSSIFEKNVEGIATGMQTAMFVADRKAQALNGEG
jgi:hypothetical protein